MSIVGIMRTHRDVASEYSTLSILVRSETFPRVLGIIFACEKARSQSTAQYTAADLQQHQQGGTGKCIDVRD
jgi:hypothetical protein